MDTHTQTCTHTLERKAVFKCNSSMSIQDALHGQSTGPPTHCTSRSCSAMESHAVKLLGGSVCADVNARGLSQQSVSDFYAPQHSVTLWLSYSCYMLPLCNTTTYSRSGNLSKGTHFQLVPTLASYYSRIFKWALQNNSFFHKCKNPILS